MRFPALVGAALVSAVWAKQPQKRAIPLERGIEPSRLSEYVPDAEGMWACRDDPTKKIPIEWVNDDFCDCADGSDEPGSAACANGKFYCANKGHVPAFIPARLVDDGNCDYDQCCDGSDEQPGLCPDRCAEVAAEQKLRDEHLRQRISAGLAARSGMIEKARALRAELESRQAHLQSELETRSSEAESQRARLAELENQAKEESGQAVPQAVAEALAAAMEAANEAEARNSKLLAAYEKMQHEATVLDRALAAMHADYNPNFNDAAVKAALRIWEDLAASRDGTEEDLVEQSLLQQPIAPGSQKAFIRAIEQAIEQVGLSKADEPPPQLSLMKEWTQSLRGFLQRMSILPGTAPHASDSVGSRVPAVVRKGREALEKTERMVSEAAAGLATVSNELAADHGPSDVFRALKNECIVATHGEYKYEVCWHDRITQIGNGQNTNLGQFEKANFDGLSASHPAAKNGGFFELYFENGARCWNGPIRRSIVRVECGAQAEFLSVTESEKCTYEIALRSPAGCISPPEEQQSLENPVETRIVHDEL